ncbi:MAG TPA: hypothetical protein VN845_11515 [Solirubrobacteraceae bacterium]|nr:hypothetical protein [Solirubrobacteraceae bacterium]
MTVDAMARLAAANPVIDPPAVESPERLRRLIEDDAPALGLGELPGGRSPIGKRSRLRRRALIAVPLCVVASVVGVVLSSGSSGPGVNVAAAAYAATTPRTGVMEAVFLARIFRGWQAGGTLRQREWSDAAARLRREQNTTTTQHGDTHEAHVLEMVFAPGRWETWSSGPEANIVTHTSVRTLILGFNLAFGGISLDGMQGIRLYRELYREGVIRLVGRERYKGRSLWKLESPSVGYANANGRRFAVRPRVGLVVLVDPKTFLPIVERQLDIAAPGHPVVVESDLLSYRRVPAGEAAAKLLFDLAAQHPGSRVVTQPSLGLPRLVHEQKRKSLPKERKLPEHR